PNCVVPYRNPPDSTSEATGKRPSPGVPKDQSSETVGGSVLVSNWNTVPPLSCAPPFSVVPKNRPLTSISPANGYAPSAGSDGSKTCSVSSASPGDMPMRKTVPPPFELGPAPNDVVPYRRPPLSINSAAGHTPSLPLNEWSVAKFVPFGDTVKIEPAPNWPPVQAVPYRLPSLPSRSFASGSPPSALRLTSTSGCTCASAGAAIASRQKAAIDARRLGTPVKALDRIRSCIARSIGLSATPRLAADSLRAFYEKTSSNDRRAASVRAGAEVRRFGAFLFGERLDHAPVAEPGARGRIEAGGFEDRVGVGAQGWCLGARRAVGRPHHRCQTRVDAFEPREPLVARLRTHHGADLVEPARVLQRQELRTLERGAERLPELRLERAERQPLAVGRFVEGVTRALEIAGRRKQRPLACGFAERNVDRRTHAGTLTLDDRREDGNRRLHRRADVRDQRTRRDGRPQQSGERLVVDVVRRPFGARAVAREADHRRADQPRMPAPQRGGVDAEPRRGRRAEAVDDDVGACEKRVQNGRCVRRSQIERDAFLAVVERVEVARPERAHRVAAARVLDLDDVGAAIREQLRRVRPGQQPRQIEDADAVKRRHGAGGCARSRTRSTARARSRATRRTAPTRTAAGRT